MFSSTDSGWKQGGHKGLSQPQNPSSYHGEACGRRCSAGNNLPERWILQKINDSNPATMMLYSVTAE
jgi:hypothetical protein